MCQNYEVSLLMGCPTQSQRLISQALGRRSKEIKLRGEMARWGVRRLGLVEKRPGLTEGLGSKRQLYYSPQWEASSFSWGSRVWVIQGLWELECRLRHTEAKLTHAPTAVVHDDVRGGVSLVISSAQFYQPNSKVVLFIKNILNECEGMARRLVDCSLKIKFRQERKTSYRAT